jgi:hypothetical protein
MTTSAEWYNILMQYTIYYIRKYLYYVVILLHGD